MELTKDLFREQLKTVFHLDVPDGTVADIELVELREGKFDRRYETFSLLFRGDGSRVFEQRTYKMRHAAIGEFDLFMTPLAQNPDGTLYEAVFNRLLNGTEAKA